jgi:hypothetical protein
MKSVSHDIHDPLSLVVESVHTGEDVAPVG